MEIKKKERSYILKTIEKREGSPANYLSKYASLMIPWGDVDFNEILKYLKQN